MEEGLSRRQTFGSHAQGRDREYNPAPRQPGSAATTKAAEKEGSGSGSGLSRMHVRTARILEVLMALDVSLLYVLYHEWPAVCDASGALKVWLLVGVIMGLPMSGMAPSCGSLPAACGVGHPSIASWRRPCCSGQCSSSPSSSGRRYSP
eukprot:TRINITY_DN60337_c0_g1_i2.p1 TRINITY_DN60337_c0_g1~~TRINITY_DN60337_c0_g1_i2.p1  ORF type:complete len:149 (-),score=30.43 TRINITY_DN60337_c0_g1_i2:157-603(-)